MKRSILVAFLSLLLHVFPSYAQTAEPLPGGLGIRAVPPACQTPGTWAAASACLDALVAKHPTLFPGAVIARQPDDGPVTVYAKGAGLAHDSVVSLASVSKPATNLALVKVVQDHFASPACTPMTANCVFPQKFETPLVDAIRVLDQRRGTDVLTRWFNRIVTDDTAQQRTWKNSIRIKHILQMTSGFPPMAFTGYRFCPGGVCPEVGPSDITCNPDTPGACRLAFLYTQYLTKRGPAIPNLCRPLPLSGPRLFDFANYYGGRVDAPDRLMRQFERRYSFEPGLFGECVLFEDATSARWADSRTLRESDVAKFYLGMPLLSEPGTQYHYSQPNLYVAAFLIEGVSGRRFNDYLKTQLFSQLGMNDSSFAIQPGTPQFQRLADIKRVPTTPARVLPDIAAPVKLDTIFGADKNWDEARAGFANDWPEGGQYSTAGDLLRFLTFIRTGKAPDGRALLNAESLRLVTQAAGPVGPRNYAFRSPAPGVLVANGFFGTYMKRDKNRCFNAAVLMQTIYEFPDFDPAHSVQLADIQFADIMRLRGALIRMVEGIPTTCDAASPPPPAPEDGIDG